MPTSTKLRVGIFLGLRSPMFGLGWDGHFHEMKSGNVSGLRHHLKIERVQKRIEGKPLWFGEIARILGHMVRCLNGTFKEEGM